MASLKKVLEKMENNFSQREDLLKDFQCDRNCLKNSHS